MLYYQEITLIDQTEISLYFIWSKLYTQLHLAFVEHKDEQEQIPYGVSFPQYRINEQKHIGFLGSKIRIFANSENELIQLNLNKWLDRLTDYVHTTSPREVPQGKITGYTCYFKANPKLTIKQRIVHQAARRNISLNEAEAHFKDLIQQPNAEPYINLKSLSHDIKFRLYIGKTLADEANNKKFGTYGLSRIATVPEF
ncbi:MAG: type I-F CRISPR-associated endoribonuclease Cas6/Csy4 [Acinetobacter populi]|jgi:CRISPR-associated endonuclease Csy4|uniref:type I-F CRISPR-associated endoribonuclease Cas6/Csy4 n=1 Tax=Acinetobacter populi TaxID=1582270 RepID=UPI0023579663|nr:type I-F CRISPR-associated endoribonuclease Cas6/Csy4 [Acinetobacter populi]MCH4248899.1 type I-F CRISPR-associated endoribonuclease Cas6/Csy4 [Acinetobacter populi]